jgi:transposase InsO family protein
MDILGPFPTTVMANKYILSIVDRFTAWIEAFPLADTSTPIIAEKFVAEIICRHGVPNEVLTDNGTNFVSNAMQQVCEMLKITKLQTTPYNPECNGITERSNQS